MARERSEAAAQEHAEFVTTSVLRGALTSEDLAAPIEPTTVRHTELAALVGSRVLRVQFPVVHVAIWRADGTIAFSDEPRVVGERVTLGENLILAFQGHVVSRVANPPDSMTGLDMSSGTSSTTPSSSPPSTIRSNSRFGPMAANS